MKAPGQRVHDSLRIPDALRIPAWLGGLTGLLSFLLSISHILNRIVSFPGRIGRMGIVGRMSIVGMFLAGIAGQVPAQAQPTAQSAGYSLSCSPNPVPSSGSGTLLLTTGHVTDLTLPTDVVLLNIATVSTAPATAPETINTPYTITLTLTLPSGPQTIKFTGMLGAVNGHTGRISAYSSDVGNQFTGTTSQTLNLGAYGVYAITLTDYVPPGPPGSASLGTINARLALVAKPAVAPAPSVAPAPAPRAHQRTSGKPLAQLKTS